MTDDIQRVRSLRRRMTMLLLGVSIGSVLSGISMIGFAGQANIWLAAIGWQFAIWGAIDLIFALLGLRQCRRADQDLLDDQAEATQLTKSLRFNGKLNVLWVVIGLALFVPGAMLGNASLIGHGVGVLLQGGFLLGFDRAFLAKLSAVTSRG